MFCAACAFYAAPAVCRCFAIGPGRGRDAGGRRNPRGDRTTATTGTAAASYGYNQANQLTTFTPPSGTATTYAYDGDGLRAAKTTGSAASSYAWDTSGAVPLMLTNGTASYLYGPGGLPVEQIGSSGTPVYLHQDQLGSTRLLTDSSGAVTGTYSYDAYGNTTSHTGTATTLLQYAGQYTDPETGLYYLRARYYDPATAQFLTTDPLDSLTQAPYSYVNGNPLNDTDPTGLCGLWCAIGIGAAVVGTAACIVVEPCGFVEGGALALAGGGTVAASLTFAGADILATGAAVGGLAGASGYMLASGNPGNSGNSGNPGNNNETCPSNNAYDPSAHALADRIGGEAQQEFTSGPAAGKEFDAVSDEYIAEAKPANQQLGSAWRRQAQAVFKQAIYSRRTPYFQFDGPPGPGVLDALSRYAARYNIEPVIDLEPLGG